MNSALSLRPFFVVGSPRSGTTLLRFMLASHSRLCIPDETGFLPFLRCDPNDDLDAEEIDKLLLRIGQLNRFWRGLITDVPAFRESLAEPRLAYILDALYRLQCQAQPAARWGDKTPLYVRYLPRLLKIFPQAQFIHVIRDGRDASLSARAKWGAVHPYMDIYYLLRNWQRNVHTGMMAAQKLTSSQYFSLHYEDLVTEPETEIKRLCDFLGETFEPAMLAHDGLARKTGGGIDAQVEVQASIHTRGRQRWRREMTPFESRLADYLLGDTLLKLGYSRADVGQLTLKDRLLTAPLASKFLLTDSTRSVLYRMGILTLNRNRR